MASSHGKEDVKTATALDTTIEVKSGNKQTKTTVDTTIEVKSIKKKTRSPKKLFAVADMRITGPRLDDKIGDIIKPILVEHKLRPVCGPVHEQTIRQYLTSEKEAMCTTELGDDATSESRRGLVMMMWVDEIDNTKYAVISLCDYEFASDSKECRVTSYTDVYPLLSEKEIVVYKKTNDHTVI